MPPPSRDTLRRLAVALAIAGIVHVAATAALGSVVADAGAPGLPAELSVRPPRAGDEALYEVDVQEPRDGPTTPIRRVTARWQTPDWAHGRDGTPRRVVPLRVQVVLDPPGETADRVVTEDLRFDAATWGLVSAVGTDERQETTDELPAGDLERVRHRFRREARLDVLQAPCGFAVPFFDGPVPIDEAVDGVGSCGASGGLEARELVDRDGIRFVRLASADGDVVLGYSPQVPFPVEIRADAGAVLPGDPVDGPVRLTLTGFRAGAGPGPGEAPDARPGPRAPVETGPTRPWGPAEGELDHPFPLSDAWEVLVDGSEDVRSFQRQHPDAYVAWARLHVRVDDAGRERRTWRVVLSDGRDRVDRFVVDAPRLEDRIRDPTDPDRVRTRSEVPFTPSDLPDAFPDPAAVPTQLPSIEAAFDRYRSLDPALGEAGPPDRWHLAFRCGSTGCDQATTTVAVGDRPDEGDRVELVLDAAGRRRALVEEGTSSTGIYAEAFHSAGPTREWTQAVPAPATWSLARWEIVAGAGALALLVGGLYLVWPKVKLAAGALYSRIGPDDVLDNDTRRRIHRLVTSEPGIHFREIKRRLDLGRGNLEHHLDKLVENGILDEHASEGYRCYFPDGRVDRRVAAVAQHLRSDNARRLLATLDRVADPSLRDLAERASVPESTASYHLKHLAEADLVEKRRRGGHLALRLTELGRRALVELKIP